VDIILLGIIAFFILSWSARLSFYFIVWIYNCSLISQDINFLIDLFHLFLILFEIRSLSFLLFTFTSFWIACRKLILFVFWLFTISICYLAEVKIFNFITISCSYEININSFGRKYVWSCSIRNWIPLSLFWPGWTLKWISVLADAISLLLNKLHKKWVFIFLNDLLLIKS
jgi:hypothetical protein